MTGAAALRWVFADELAHVLGEGGVGDQADLAYVTVCGLGVSATEPVYAVPPSLDVCPVCVPLPSGGFGRPSRLDVPPPEHPTMPTVF